MRLPISIKATELTCPHCHLKHTFSGYLEDKNIVYCPGCNKTHPIKSKAVASSLKINS